VEGAEGGRFRHGEPAGECFEPDCQNENGVSFYTDPIILNSMADQAKPIIACLRLPLRIAAATILKPAIIVAQVAGSGTGAKSMVPA